MPETAALPKWLWIPRLIAALLELIAVVLLIVRPGLGGALAAVLMVGVIGAHLGFLGADVEGDSAFFIIAFVALASSRLVAWLDRKTVPLLCKT